VLLTLLKQKIIKIKRSKYGDWYGMVNGKFKYQDPNAINLKGIKGHININVESSFGTVVLKLPEHDFTSTLTGEFDFGQCYYPYFSDFTKYLNMITLFTKNHWKEGLTIGSVVWTFFKEIGILAVPLNKFYRI